MNYQLLLKEHNLKATPQRLEILDVIAYYGHISIESLYENIKNKFSSISLATIYKNINAMTKNSLLFEVKLPNEKSVYEIVKEEHSHLLCNSCGTIQDVSINLDTIEDDISKNYQFKISQTDLVVSGVCAKCED